MISVLRILSPQRWIGRNRRPDLGAQAGAPSGVAFRGGGFQLVVEVVACSAIGAGQDEVDCTDDRDHEHHEQGDPVQVEVRPRRRQPGSEPPR